jgi:hypothetical protein
MTLGLELPDRPFILNGLGKVTPSIGNLRFFPGEEGSVPGADAPDPLHMPNDRLPTQHEMQPLRS